jgi:hypothetical protein
MITGNRNELFLRYFRVSEKEEAMKSSAMVISKQTPEQKTNGHLAGSMKIGQCS